jgi:hypothetical protein
MLVHKPNTGQSFALCCFAHSVMNESTDTVAMLLIQRPTNLCAVVSAGLPSFHVQLS